jgi:two-component system chemotaxis response regulator CheY
MTRILVVDDEPSIRELLREALELEGYGVAEACNGLEGLTVYHQIAIELVITDLEMPEMDGVTMIKTLRGEQVVVPVIVISGMNQERFDNIKTIGVQSILAKPFYLKELLHAVQTLVGRGSIDQSTHAVH